MTYIDYLNHFNLWLESNALEASAQLMYFKLLNVFNRAGWPDTVQVDNRRMERLLGGVAKTTVIRARDRLIEAGFIRFCRGRRGSPNRYELAKEFSDATYPATYPATISATENATPIAVVQPAHDTCRRTPPHLVIVQVKLQGMDVGMLLKIPAESDRHHVLPLGLINTGQGKQAVLLPVPAPSQRQSGIAQQVDGGFKQVEPARFLGCGDGERVVLVAARHLALEVAHRPPEGGVAYFALPVIPGEQGVVVLPCFSQ